MQIARMCSSGRDELRRACSTSSGQRRLHRGGVVQGDFRLGPGRLGDALAAQSIFLASAFFLTLVDNTLKAAGAWVERLRLRGIRGGCHCRWMFEVGVMYNE